MDHYMHFGVIHLRFNGILGSMHTNRKSIEPQLMKKFCQSQEHSTTEISTPSDFIAVLLEKSKINDMITIFILNRTTKATEIQKNA